MLGNAGVGKTSLLAAMAGTVSTPGVEFRVKMATLNGEIVKLQLWDTANQERHCGPALPKSYYRRARGVLLVYDASNEQSFVDVVHWAMLLESLRDDSEPLSVVVVSNQTRSKHPVVSTDHGRVLATLLGASFVEWTAPHDATTCLDQLIHSLSVEKLWQVDVQGLSTRLQALSAVEKPDATMEALDSETESESEDSELESVETAHEILPSMADIITTRGRRDSGFFESLELGQAASATAAKLLTSRDELGYMECLGLGVILLACSVVALLLLIHYEALGGTCSIIANALAWTAPICH
jgi:Ras-related protein Rab-1A